MESCKTCKCSRLNGTDLECHIVPPPWHPVRDSDWCAEWVGNIQQIHPIHNDTDLKFTLARIDQLMDARKGTPDGDELEVLAILVENYEKETGTRVLERRK